jgi:hypothetical protein
VAPAVLAGLAAVACGRGRLRRLLCFVLLVMVMHRHLTAAYYVGSGSNDDVDRPADLTVRPSSIAILAISGASRFQAATVLSSEGVTPASVITRCRNRCHACFSSTSLMAESLALGPAACRSDSRSPLAAQEPPG